METQGTVHEIPKELVDAIYKAMALPDLAGKAMLEALVGQAYAQARQAYEEQYRNREREYNLRRAELERLAAQSMVGAEENKKQLLLQSKQYDVQLALNRAQAIAGLGAALGQLVFENADEIGKWFKRTPKQKAPTQSGQAPQTQPLVGAITKLVPDYKLNLPIDYSVVDPKTLFSGISLENYFMKRPNPFPNIKLDLRL